MSPWKLLSAQELSHRVHGAAELAQILACPVSLGPSIGKIPLSSAEDSLGLIFPGFFLDILPGCL